MLQIEKIQRIDLGIQGENETRKIEIDCSAWGEMYPNGAISILHKRHGEESASVTGASYDGETGILTWEPTDTDTYYAGEGEAQIRVTESGIVRKTIVLKTLVRESIVNDAGSSVGSDWDSYIEEVERLKNGAVTAKNAAEAAEDDAAADALVSEGYAKGTQDGESVDSSSPYYQGNAKYYKEQAASSATAAAGSATAAAGSATAAAGSATAAAGSASDAAGSATAAAGSASDAAGSATAAAGSAETAGNSATAASESATAASGSKTAAASSALSASGYKTAARTDALRAEGFAYGTQNGENVGDTSPYYHANARYYKEQADDSATAAGGSATAAATSAMYSATDALKSEGYAVGKQNGTDVGSDSVYYHGNAKYYKEQAASSATAAGNSETAASGSASSAATNALKAEGYAAGTQNGTDVGSDSPYYHNNGKYYLEQTEAVAESIPEDYSELSDDVSDLKSAINAMATGVDSSDFTWTLKYNYNSSGQLVSNNGCATTGYVNVSPGNVIVNTCSGVGYNDKTDFIQINEFNASGVWLSRTQLAAGESHVITANCKTIRIAYGYGISTGITITQAIVDTYFSAKMVSEAEAKAHAESVKTELLDKMADNENVDLLPSATYTDGKYAFVYNGAVVINSANTAVLFTIDVSKMIGRTVNITSYIADNLRVILAGQSDNVIYSVSGTDAIGLTWTIPSNATTLYVSALKAKEDLTSVRVANKDGLILEALNNSGSAFDYSGCEYLFIKDESVICSTARVSSSGIVARYCMADIGAVAQKVMCKFKTTGGVLTLITTNQTRVGFIDNIVYQSVHITFTRAKCNVSVFKNSTLTDVEVITYDTAIPADGETEYEVGFEFLGSGQLKVYLPDGTNQTVTDTRFDEYNGQYVIYEIYKDSVNTSAEPTISFGRPSFTGFYAKPVSGKPLRDSFKRLDGNLTVAPSGHMYRLARNGATGDTYYDEVNNIQG